MRRKSPRTAAPKASPEKTKSPPRKPRRYTRRKKQAASESSDDSQDDQSLQEIAKQAANEKSTSEEAEPIWKVTASDAPTGVVQKLKICLTRPSPSTPERTSRRQRRKSRGEDVSTPNEESSTQEDEKSSEVDDKEEKRGKGKSKGKHKSKIEKTPQPNEQEAEMQSEISENVQVTAQSPPIDIPVDNRDAIPMEAMPQIADNDTASFENVTVTDNANSEDQPETADSIVAQTTNNDSCEKFVGDAVASPKEQTSQIINDDTDVQASPPPETNESIQPEIAAAEETDNKSRDSSTKEDLAVTKPQDSPTQEKLIVSKSQDSSKQEELIVSKPQDSSTQEELIVSKSQDSSKQEEIIVSKPQDSLTQEKEVVSKPQDSLKQEELIDSKPQDSSTQEKLIVSKPRDSPTQEDSIIEESERHEEGLKESVINDEEQESQTNEESIIKEEPTTNEESITKEESTTNEESITKEESTTNEDSITKEESTTNEESITKEESTTNEEFITKEESTTNEESITNEAESPANEAELETRPAEESPKSMPSQTENTTNESFVEYMEVDVSENEHFRIINEEIQKNDTPVMPKRKRKWGSRDYGFKTYYTNLLKIDIDSIKDICTEVKFLDENEVKLEATPPVERRKSVDQKPKKPERKVSVDESTKTELKPQTSVNSTNSEEYNFETSANIIAMNRKISIVDDTASKLKPPPSPAKNPISDVLFITNLVRPFTIKQLKELLERTGKIKEDGFWTDHIKSKCYVQYESSEEAEATRNALHGVQWPIGNGKKLIIEYSVREELEKAKNPPPPAPVATEAKSPEKEIDVAAANKHPKEDTTLKGEDRREKRKKETQMREWDIGKEDLQRERSRSRERKRHARRSASPLDDFITRKQRKQEDAPPQKLMDDLFQKTKATPCIYWLPLTPEEIALKQQQRLIRMEEHKRRLEEAVRNRGDFARGGPYRRRYD